jgi:4-hydroxymandelate oxidase
LASGAADERTLEWNRAAYDKIRLRPRILRDVSHIDTSITLLVQRMAFPILLAPTAFQALYHPEGEIATAKGAGEAATTYVVSSFTTVRHKARHPAASTACTRSFAYA